MSFYVEGCQPPWTLPASRCKRPGHPYGCSIRRLEPSAIPANAAAFRLMRRQGRARPAPSFSAWGAGRASAHGFPALAPAAKNSTSTVIAPRSIPAFSGEVFDIPRHCRQQQPSRILAHFLSGTFLRKIQLDWCASHCPRRKLASRGDRRLILAGSAIGHASALCIPHPLNRPGRGMPTSDGVGRRCDNLSD